MRKYQPYLDAVLEDVEKRFCANTNRQDKLARSAFWNFFQQLMKK